MLDILLSDHSQHPLYMQLYMQIRNRIRSGAITHGTRLPSVRTLQLQLNISKTPIETAYQMLSAEGYTVSKPRSGLYAVNPYETALAFRESPAPPALQPDPQLPSRTPESPHVFIDFDPSATDELTFPIRAWKQVLQLTLESSSGRICKYGDPQGEYAFRSVLADYLRNARGVICTPEQIVVGSGISYSIGLLTKLLAGIRQVAIEEPGFEKVRELFRQNGFGVIPVPVHEKGLLVEQLNGSEAQAVYVTPSHQFPTGGVLPYAEREYLLNWANSRNAYIIEDDYDGEFRYFGKPIPSLQSLDRQGRVIYLGTFSKAFTPAFRMNYMVLPMELAGMLGSIQPLLVGPSRIDQWAMQTFMEQGHWYRHIRKMRNTYRKKHARFIALMRTHFAECVQITGHQAGIHIQVTVKTRLTAKDLVKLAADEGVRVYDFRQMWMHPEPFGYPKIYLGFGGIREADMERGVLLLKKAWSEI